MRFLLDTHVWLWLQVSPHRVPPDLLGQLTLADAVYLSAASTWEIAIKNRLGKLPLPEPPTSYVPERMTRSGTEPLRVEIHHTLAAGQLPLHHRDPFDRLLVAQSRILSLPLVTADERLGAYDVDLRWE